MEWADYGPWMSHHVDAYLGGETTALDRCLATFTGGAAIELLLAAVRDQERREFILSRSYLHPNGFLKLVLASGTAYQLRLHIWPAHIGVGSEPGGENIHNHRWDFATVLLLGAYRHEQFSESPFGREFHAYYYGAERGSSSYSLRPNGKRRLMRSFAAQLSAGSGYTLGTDVLHRVISDPGRLTATLVLQGPSTSVPVQVFSERAIDCGPELPLPRLLPAELTDRVEELLGLLASPGGAA